MKLWQEILFGIILIPILSAALSVLLLFIVLNTDMVNSWTSNSVGVLYFSVLFSTFIYILLMLLFERLFLKIEIKEFPIYFFLSPVSWVFLCLLVTSLLALV